MSAALDIDYSRLADEIAKRTLTDGWWTSRQIGVWFGVTGSSSISRFTNAPDFPLPEYFTLADGRKTKRWKASRVKVYKSRPAP